MEKSLQVHSKSDSHFHPSRLDLAGLILSLACGVHCLLTPLMMIFLPIMGKFYWAHPLVHYFLSFAILPIGAIAFLKGYFRHKKIEILIFGFTGLLMISVVPTLVHAFGVPLPEIPLMIIASVFLVWAHWSNQKQCTC